LKEPCEKSGKLINLSSTIAGMSQTNAIYVDAKEDGIIFPRKFKSMA